MPQALDVLAAPQMDAKATSACALRTDVITELAAFLERRQEIDALCEDLCEENVFYETWMIEPAIRHLGRDVQLRFLCFYESCSPYRLCGVFPLVRKAMHPLLPIRTYELWRHTHCFRCTPLVRKGFAESCWKALFDWIRCLPSGQQLLYVARLPAGGEVELGLRLVLDSNPALRYVHRSQESAFLRIEDDGEKTLRRAMSASTLRKLRRQQRRLAERGELVFSELDTEDDLTHIVDQFLQLEASGWKGTQGTALSCNAEEEAFFRTLMFEANARNRLSVLTMRLDGKLIAAQTSLLGRSGSFLFKTAYDESFSKYSPGVLLEIEHLRRMHDVRDPKRQQHRWSDSCATPGNGPVYRCWPDRRTILDFRVASGFGLPAMLLAAWPALRGLYRTLHPVGSEQPKVETKATADRRVCVANGCGLPESHP